MTAASSVPTRCRRLPAPASRRLAEGAGEVGVEAAQPRPAVVQGHVQQIGLGVTQALGGAVEAQAAVEGGGRHAGGRTEGLVEA